MTENDPFAGAPIPQQSAEPSTQPPVEDQTATTPVGPSNDDTNDKSASDDKSSSDNEGSTEYRDVADGVKARTMTDEERKERSSK